MTGSVPKVRVREGDGDAADAADLDWPDQPAVDPFTGQPATPAPGVAS